MTDQIPPGSPWEALARRGVPISCTPDGRPILKSGGGPGDFMLPPEIPGMPQMPSPPGWFTGGGSPGGGLFQPLEPVAPFDLNSQVRRMHLQGPPKP